MYRSCEKYTSQGKKIFRSCSSSINFKSPGEEKKKSYLIFQNVES